MLLLLACTGDEVVTHGDDSAPPEDTAPVVDTAPPEDTSGPGDSADTHGDTGETGKPVDTEDTGKPPAPLPCEGRTAWPDRLALAEKHLVGVSEGWEINQYPPSFTKQAQDEAWYDLRQFFGDVIVVEVAAGWCPYCTGDAPSYQSLYDTWQEHCFTFVTVLEQDGTNAPADVDYAAAWANGYGLTHPVMADPEQDLHEQAGSTTTPQFWVLDRSFKIRAYFSGETDPAYLQQYIQALVDDPVPE